MNISIVGFGDSSFQFAVYIGNKPAVPEYEHLAELVNLQEGDIQLISNMCGNGWRKVFNVYAKLLYALKSPYFEFSALAPTWQSYRDNFLLQKGSQTALLFTPPSISSLATVQPNATIKQIHLICGRTHAKKMQEQGVLNIPLTWLNEEFAINKRSKVIVCPYFDYRQLSNNKIEYLADLLSDLVT